MEKMIARKVSERDREYLRDESRMSGYAEEIAFPETEPEILQVVQEALGRKISITVQGARTGITGAAVPQGGQILSLTNYNRILGLEQKAIPFMSGYSRAYRLNNCKKHFGQTNGIRKDGPRNLYRRWRS